MLSLHYYHGELNHDSNSLNCFCSYRLKQELEALMKDECQSYHKSLGTFNFKFHEAPTHPNCIAWLGGKVSPTLVVVNMLNTLGTYCGISGTCCESKHL